MAHTREGRRMAVSHLHVIKIRGNLKLINI